MLCVGYLIVLNWQIVKKLVLEFSIFELRNWQGAL